MKRNNREHPWSEEEVARLMRVYRECSARRTYRFWKDVMSQMPGRTESQCRSKVNYQRYGSKYRGRNSENPSLLPNIPSVRVPDRVLADAERRRSLNRPTITAQFFGDPLPGYSALDRRQ